MPRKVLLVGGIILVVVIAAIAFLSFTQKRALSGSVLNPPWPSPEIALTDQSGQPYSLHAQRGKVVLIYFGYTNCPNECPLTMAHAKLARESLGERAGDVQVVMVSTDPVRDTPEALAHFMGSFGPDFLGLTGTQAELEKAWKDYGVTVEQGGEAHSTFLYVVDPAGDIRETFQPDADPAVIAADLDLLLKGK